MSSRCTGGASASKALPGAAPPSRSSCRCGADMSRYANLFTADKGARAPPAPGPRGALAALAKEPVHVIISDYMMPGMNGAEFLKQARARWPQTIRIMLTGHADTNAVMGAIKEGAVYKFILKPWNDDDLRVTVALAIEQYELMQKNKALAQQNANKAREIGELSKLAVS